MLLNNENEVSTTVRGKVFHVLMVRGINECLYIIVSVCKWTMIEVWSGSIRGSSNYNVLPPFSRAVVLLIKLKYLLYNTRRVHTRSKVGRACFTNTIVPLGRA